MRPEILYPLFADLKTLPGVGGKVAEHFVRLTSGSRLLDLIWHFPSYVQKRYRVENLKTAPVDQLITCTVTVLMHHTPLGRMNKRKPYRVDCVDGYGNRLSLVFFNARQDYLVSQLPIDSQRVISGKIELFRGQKQMTHPDHIGLPGSEADWVGSEGIYPLTYGLTQKMTRKTIQQALAHIPELPEWLSPELISKRSWPSFKEAILRLHYAQTDAELDVFSPARRRLAFDELFANQLALGLIRRHHRQKLGTPLLFSKVHRQKIIDSLPFALTSDQNKALAEIDADMASPQQMIRLLQGDVGSGKTIVAFLAMLNAVEAESQAALMVPTEILARQHYATLKPWADLVGVRIECLTGQDSGKARAQILDDLKVGKIDIIIGTHALIQGDVEFQNLKLAVVDEQHRFGVEQRIRLVSKGTNCNLLVMSATPIPRTLMMTIHGDLDVSFLREKPANRKEIKTALLNIQKIESVISNLKQALNAGKKAYWVCPLVAESEDLDLAAAEQRFKDLSRIMGQEHVALVHGRMSAQEKEKEMQHFLTGDCRLLVATTVIEVGVHVEDATIMVIEHAERFGLAQLHQLRGRIGRSDLDSSCLLLYDRPLSPTAEARLKIMRETTDGFRIAEEDFKLRGGGDVLSSRQSGLPPTHVADYFAHQDLMVAANELSASILEKDPYLNSVQGKVLRILLYLFEKDTLVQMLVGG